MLFYDYHLHTRYSFDCRSELAEVISCARKAGMYEICLCDHVDFGGLREQVKSHKGLGEIPADLRTRDAALALIECKYGDITVRRGAEIGLDTGSAASESYDYIKDMELDYLIGSVHEFEGKKPYNPDYFTGKSIEQAYRGYLAFCERSIRSCPYMSAMGHFDFCAKYAPYENRAMRYDMAPDVFDAIFRYLVQNGKTLEINTASWGDAPAWGLDILSRFAQLGGEFVTVGSDAHKPERAGRRISEAYALAEAAGIRYIATYKRLKPIMHRIQ